MKDTPGTHIVRDSSTGEVVSREALDEAAANKRAAELNRRLTEGDKPQPKVEVKELLNG